jgi:GNAT superfamily N-acetyltransferase
MPQVTIRAAQRGDGALIAQFVRELAIYEKLEHEMVATGADFERDLFGETPRAEVFFVCEDEVEVGFALFFFNYSTFEGRVGIHLEDLFVRPAFRGRGYGKTLIVAIARRAIEMGCARFEWTVLDWNVDAIAVYRALGAQAMDEWTIQRVSGAALEAVAARPLPGETAE